MRYFMTIIPPADLKPEDVSQGLMDAMGPWMDRNLKSGALVSTGGLKPAERGQAAHWAHAARSPQPTARSPKPRKSSAATPCSRRRTSRLRPRSAPSSCRCTSTTACADITLEIREIAGGANY